MPRIKKKITTEMIGEEEDEKDLEDDAEDLAIESAVMDFAEGERLVKLYRYPGNLGGRPRFLGGLAREDFNEVFIQERFGGGRFFGRWRKKNGQYTRFSFEIEGETKIITRAEEVRREVEEQGEPYPYLQRQGQQETGSDKINMIDVLKMMAETRKESREEMRVMLEMMRPAQSAPDATEKVFSLVEKLAPLISQGGGEGGGNPWLFALSQLKEPLLKIVDTIQVAVTRGPAQAGPSPVPAQRPLSSAATLATASHVPGPGQPVEPHPQPTAEVAQPTGGDMIEDSFKEYWRWHLPMLVKAASEKKDPDLYCDLVLDQVPSFAYPRLRAWLLKPGCLDALAVHAPIIAQDPMQRVWWEALRGLLIDAISEELGDAPHNLQLVPDSVSPGPGPADSA